MTYQMINLLLKGIANVLCRRILGLSFRPVSSFIDFRKVLLLIDRLPVIFRLIICIYIGKTSICKFVLRIFRGKTIPPPAQ